MICFITPNKFRQSPFVSLIQAFNKQKRKETIMSINNNNFNQTNQDYFIGLDVHKKSWTVCIRNSGLFLKKFSMNPSPLELYKYLKRKYPDGIYYSVYEAGYCGYWIDRELKKLGINNIIVSPSDIPTTSRDKFEKTDPRDARNLAMHLQNRTIKGIYIPNDLQLHIRSLSRLRCQLIKQQSRLKNQIKAYLYFYGICLPDNSVMLHWTGKFIEHIRTFEFSQPAGKVQLEIYITSLLEVRIQILNTVRLLRKTLKDNHLNEPVLKLCKIPGIGFTTAVTLYTELMDIKRFSSFDKLVSFVGLSPSRRRSAETEKVLGISFHYNKYLRSMLVESAWIAVRVDPSLTNLYGQYIRRMSKQEAIIRIAKKLLSRLRFVWLNNKQYQNYSESLEKVNKDQKKIILKKIKLKTN